MEVATLNARCMIAVSDSEVIMVLPALNECDGVSLTIKEALGSLSVSRIVVVNGHSIDGTPEVAANCGATVLNQREHGKGAAILEALEYLGALSQKPGCLVFCDADYSYSLQSLPAMVGLITGDPSVGMVVGNRFSEFKLWDYFKDRYMFGNLILRGMHRLLNGVRLKDPLSGLRILRFKAVEGLKVESRGFDVEVELNCRLLERGWRIYEVPVMYRRRVGRKKLRVRDGFGILNRMLKHSLGWRS